MLGWTQRALALSLPLLPSSFLRKDPGYYTASMVLLPKLLSLCHIFYIKVWTIYCESTIYRLYGIYFLAGMLQQLVKHSKSLHKFLSVLRFNLFRA